VLFRVVGLARRASDGELISRWWVGSWGVGFPAFAGIVACLMPLVVVATRGTDAAPRWTTALTMSIRYHRQHSESILSPSK
jgi:hypothetical protein